MNLVFRLLLLFGFAAAVLPAPASAQDPAVGTPVRIILAGDSTVCNYSPDRPERGWGMYLEEHFKEGSVEVINLAKGGRSTKTFLQEGLWKKALEAKPDYVLIQFGHNDSHTADKPESTDASTDFKEYLRQYITEARGIGATPILVTPVVRRIFDREGKLRNGLARYAEAMKEVGIEMKAAVIDLNATSKSLAEQLGPEKSAEMASKPGSMSHFNEQGARVMAGLVLAEIPTAAPKLGELIKAP